MKQSYTSEQIAAIAVIRDALRSGMAEAIREDAGILRSEMAARMKCHASAITRWERAERVPRPDVSLRLAEVYGEFAALASGRISEAV